MQDDRDRKAEKQSPSQEGRPDAADSRSASAGEHDHPAAFDQHRGLLFSIAYRMLGSRADAEDMLQETFIRWQQASATEIRDPRAFLVTVITRLCINQLQSARVKREQYFGQWLPEPLMAKAAAESPAISGIDGSLSMAFLMLLERLTPMERAVFLLREVHPEATQFGFRDVGSSQKLLGRNDHAAGANDDLSHSAKSRNFFTFRTG